MVTLSEVYLLCIAASMIENFDTPFLTTTLDLSFSIKSEYVSKFVGAFQGSLTSRELE